MATEVFYRQCVLRMGCATTTTWLPERYAITGKIIDLKTSKDTWDKGWVVESVGINRWPEEWVRDRSQDYKHQREASDI